MTFLHTPAVIATPVSIQKPHLKFKIAHVAAQFDHDSEQFFFEFVLARLQVILMRWYPVARSKSLA